MVFLQKILSSSFFCITFSKDPEEVLMLISIEAHITCNFPGGGGGGQDPLSRLLDPHMFFFQVLSVDVYLSHIFYFRHNLIIDSILSRLLSRDLRIGMRLCCSPLRYVPISHLVASSYFVFAIFHLVTNHNSVASTYSKTCKVPV